MYISNLKVINILLTKKVNLIKNKKNKVFNNLFPHFRINIGFHKNFRNINSKTGFQI